MSSSLTPAERKLRAEKAIATRWANSTREERQRILAKARSVFMDRFEKQVDPEGKLDPKERAFRAEHAKKAYFAGLALKAAQARRRRRSL